MTEQHICALVPFFTFDDIFSGLIQDINAILLEEPVFSIGVEDEFKELFLSHWREFSEKFKTSLLKENNEQSKYQERNSRQEDDSDNPTGIYSQTRTTLNKDAAIVDASILAPFYKKDKYNTDAQPQIEIYPAIDLEIDLEIDETEFMTRGPIDEFNEVDTYHEIDPYLTIPSSQEYYKV